ncbi:MAG: histidine phosphatase family protein [Anaerolineae bacterium]
MFPQPLMTLLLVRHGQTQANVEGRFYGRTDSPMTEEGHKQVQATAERLKDWPVSHVYSSPAMRAKHTAEILNQQWQKPLTLDERLWEMDHNRWELLTPTEIQATYPMDWEKFLSGDTSAAHHGGETYQQVADRSRALIDDIKGQHSCTGETIALAAHGGTLGIMMCELLGTANRGWWPYRFKNAGVAEIVLYEFGGVLTGFQ